MDMISRPIGPLVDFGGAAAPDGKPLIGAHVRLEEINPAQHGAALWAQIQGHDQNWDYLFEEPPEDEARFLEIVGQAAANTDWMGYAVCLPGGAVVGYAYYLNISPAMGTIEVGNINFAPALQQTIAATEAMYLMMREAFALGYRRYEWKCNALNMPSRRAAQRFGFSWESIFRQHYIVKGRNRDTAWFAMTDGDWAKIGPAFEHWLAPGNFDQDGGQRQALRDLTAPHRVAGDPEQTD